jgi:2-oxoglutarate ferredoxin oxidoreductase subunit gamma
MMFGQFHGSVRGGKTETTLVTSDTDIQAPPIIPQTWSAVALHDRYFDTVEPRIRPGGLCVINSSLFERAVARTDVELIEVPMLAIAEELGNVMLVGMVALGAYVASAKLVPMEAVVEAMRGEIPSYRANLIPVNEEAIARGAGFLGEKVVAS